MKYLSSRVVVILVAGVALSAICGAIASVSRLKPEPEQTAKAHEAVDPRIYGPSHDATQTLAHAYLQWRAEDHQCLIGFDTTDGRYGFFVVPADWCVGMR